MKNGSVVKALPDRSTASEKSSRISLIIASQTSLSSFLRAQGNPFQDSISSSSRLLWDNGHRLLAVYAHRLPHQSQPALDPVLLAVQLASTIVVQGSRRWLPAPVAHAKTKEHFGLESA